MNVMGIIFSNVADMGALTDKRSKGSVPFGGRYRQIDFHLSNMVCAGIRHIGITSRHNYQSLLNHIGSGEEWGLEPGEGALEFLTPYSMSTTDSYRGKLEALYTAMDFLEFSREEYVVTADAAILCNMDMSKIIDAHIASGKDITVVAKAGLADGKRQLDLAILKDGKGGIADIAVNYTAPADYLASMDIFVISRELLMTKVRELIAHNQFHLDRDLVLGEWQKGKISVNVFEYDGIAMFNEDEEDYLANSLSLIDKDVRHHMFGACHPVYTRVRDCVPSYYGENCQINDCTVADGCVLEGTATESILFRQVNLKEGASVEKCVIMNDAVIGENAQLKYVILDKDVTVRPGTMLIGTPQAPIIIRRGETV